MIAKCPEHDKPMKLIPAGTSKKTGKPYKAFYACTSYNCRETAPAVDEEDSMVQAKKFEEELEKDYSNDVNGAVKEFTKEITEAEDTPMNAEERMWRKKEEREAARAKEKNEQIARLTLAKSFIQAGVDFDNAVKNNDLDKWTKWVLEG